MNDIIKKAMQVFEVPSHRSHYLFLLPAFYVAKADGKLSIKETMSLRLNAAKNGLIGPQDEESEDLENFLENKIEQFSGKIGFADLDLLANAINARLEKYSSEKAQAIRERIYDLCIKVADASGPVFGENISDEEKQMLEKIFYKLEK